MKRKRKIKKQNQVKREGFYIDPEIKKGVLILILVALITLSFLSLFNLAGRFGFVLRENVMKIAFGGGYFIFPFLLTAVTYLLITARKKTLKVIHYIGMTFFILSFYGFLHLTVSLDESLQAASEGLGGGYAGVILSYPAMYALDFWGSFIILLIIFIASTMVLFNITLDKMLSGLKVFKFAYGNIRQVFSGIKGRMPKKDKVNGEAREGDLGHNENYEDQEEENYEEEKEVNFSKHEIENKKSLDSEDGQSELKFKTGVIKRKIDLPLNLLGVGGNKPTSGDIERNKDIIKRTLENFNIEVEMGDISVGPTVTQYTLRPSEGVKLSQIVSLSNDLALSLAAHPIRIEAPIPGKALVGIEVPNKTVAQVRVRDIIDSPEFKKRDSNLMISLGKDVTGKIWFTDLTKNPHLLVAGSTGSGKTICINSIIISLMYQNSPEDIKFILVDPKRVELTNYNGTPYLVTPVITDVRKAVNSLKWAVREMERRFDKFEKAGNKDILSYRSSGHEMSAIVIIIDELADLMMAAGPELEALIVRLAQKSRATGIHLILATQRPSVNVITGVIKANITSRIAFRVASLVDSRTILDSSGAEKLLGRGDMLFVSAEVSKPKRLQGAFVSEDEGRRVTNHLRDIFQDVEYNKEVTEKPKNANGMEISDGDGEDEDLIEDAQEIIIRSGKASTSYLQRRMRIGYNKAARIIDVLEERGIVGPPEGPNKGREVLISKEALDEEQELNEE
jgi:DNA segregation ATPase FtsK/SpoIIIE, S-DNA-T family